MRYSKDHKIETHARIVENASILLREKGVEGIGVAALMKEAGLTHGGFYAHFKSRDALIAEAFAHAMDQTTKKWRNRADLAKDGERLAAIVNGYLTLLHRDNVGNGCALPALGAEVPRASTKTRKEAAAKVEEMIDMVANYIPAKSFAEAKRHAIASLSTMLGTLVLARMAGTGQLSSDILEAGRNASLAVEVNSKPATKKATKKSVTKAKSGSSAKRR